MINIGWNDRSSASYFRPHEFRCDNLWQRRTKTVAFQTLFTLGKVVLTVLSILTMHIFSDGNVFHFGSYYPLSRVIQLRDGFTILRATSPSIVPAITHRGYATVYVYLCAGVAVNTGAIVDRHNVSIRQSYVPTRHLQISKRTA